MILKSIKLTILIMSFSIIANSSNACGIPLLKGLNQSADAWLTKDIPEDMYLNGFEKLEVYAVPLNRYTSAVEQLIDKGFLKLEKNTARAYLGYAYDEQRSDTYYLVRGVMSELPGNIDATWLSDNKHLDIAYTYLGKGGELIFLPVVVSVPNKPLSISVTVSGGIR